MQLEHERMTIALSSETLAIYIQLGPDRNLFCLNKLIGLINMLTRFWIIPRCAHANLVRHQLSVVWKHSLSRVTCITGTEQVPRPS